MESALYAASTAVEHEHLTVFEVAALLGAYLLTSHPFLDGNKRAATAAILVTLNRSRAADRPTDAV